MKIRILAWFKWFEVCAAANGWDEVKKLLCLSTLLTSHTWAVFKLFGRSQYGYI